MSIKQLNVINENTDKYGIMEVCPIKPIRSSMGGGIWPPQCVLFWLPLKYDFILLGLNGKSDI